MVITLLLMSGTRRVRRVRTRVIPQRLSGMIEAARNDGTVSARLLLLMLAGRLFTFV